MTRATAGNWIGRYLEAIAAERGAARNTLAAYARDLNDFAGFCESRNKALDTASRREIEEFIKEMETCN